MTTQAKKQTDAILDHHLEALMAWDIDAILADYSDDSTIFTPQATVTGIDDIRQFFGGMQELIQKLLASFELVRRDANDEVAYLVWSAGDIAPLGTDTFVVRNGKIVTQTFAAYIPQ